MKHCTKDTLFNLITSNNSPSSKLVIKRHLNSCRSCWNLWNRVRWDEAKKKQGFKELHNYLGKSFKWYLDSSWELAREWDQLHPQTLREVEAFYKHTENYLYNLTLWHESGDRYDLIPEFKRLEQKIHIESVLDYGCGIGSDGLRIIELHKKVVFYDFKNPSTKFLQWRLSKRNLSNSLLFVEDAKPFPEVDLVWAIDVLEHMLDPLKILEAISDKTKVFVHLSQFGDICEGRHPFHLDFNISLLNDSLVNMGFHSDESFTTLNVWIRK